jgi:predicted methyltransferase
MKKYLFVFGLTVLMAGSYSCKSKKDNAGTETTTTTTTPSTAPVEISDDDELEKGVDEVTKDFPGVDADVDDGVITLTGTIDRDRYMTLKQALDALRPKQVVNNLKYN